MPSKSNCGAMRLHEGFDQSMSLVIWVDVSPACVLAQTWMPVPSRCWCVVIEMRCVPAIPGWKSGPVENVEFGGMLMLVVPKKSKPAGWKAGALEAGVVSNVTLPVPCRSLAVVLM